MKGVGQGGGRPPLARRIGLRFREKSSPIVSLPRVFLHEVRRETAKRALLNFGRILGFFITRKDGVGSVSGVLVMKSRSGGLPLGDNVASPVSQSRVKSAPPTCQRHALDRLP